MRDDMTNDTGRWLPNEGDHDLEIINMQEAISKQGNSKYVIDFASADNPEDVLQQNLTNIPGKRWLLRQLLEAVGIKPEKNKEGKKIYDWETDDVIGKTVTAQIVHDETPFIGRDGNEIVIPKAKVIKFKKLTIQE